MRAKAVIYDRWLHSMGGGEVVACTVARILRDLGYEVLFISGKKVAKKNIYNKLKINLSKIHFVQVWNDEIVLRKFVKNKDLFINISFLDFSVGGAKKNIYYANFPSKPYDNLRGLLLTRLVFPIVTKFLKPIESINLIDAPIIQKNRPAYILGEKNKYALYNLEIDKPQLIKFDIFALNFSKYLLENIRLDLENGQIISKKIQIHHRDNIMSFTIQFLPKSNTIYLKLDINKIVYEDYNIEEEKVFLFYPKIQIKSLSKFMLSPFIERFRNRLRAGIYVNMIERLSTFNAILTYSHFAQRWIKKYWNRSAIVVAPPVDLLFKKYELVNYRKKNWICSVGRFFTLGHGKKQEILIEAFKALSNQSEQKWELHLIGGLGDEPSSIDFFKYLKEEAKGYPVFFHINISRQEVEEIYLRSKIYWHATGFDEDENDQPVRFEHFGIAPVEAMSAGCIPLLFNGGNLPDLIRLTGFSELNLFKTINELVSKSEYFMNKSPKINWENVLAILDKKFSVEAFERNFKIILNNLGLPN